VPAPAPVPQCLPTASAIDSASHKAGSGLSDAYRAWDRFDELNARADVENEGLDPENPNAMMRAAPGVAAIQCVDYVKDKEEIGLDQELEEKRTSLQHSFNSTAKQAADLKAKGNRLLGEGHPAEALEAYLEGEHSLEVITGHASILLSARLLELTRSLRRDLQNNAAQAALTLKEWDEAIRAASAVLADESAQPKALYRRAAAHVGRAAAGDLDLARADLKALLRVQPHNGAARKMLDELGHEV